ncbi:hypothetical protein BOTCAL_0637g00010 [Botryotinia calthae]|uniref:Uncharacterized protein n=1 Tax=Botryotinia calthae TaxID=38488 RepID=A0A4Y8CIY4_9HELO|nr:hypothetical protein BOTCAL_0637g00010 [Botryotinia calthae]
MSAPNEIVWLDKLFLFRLNNKVVDTFESSKKKILKKFKNKKVKKVEVVEVVEVVEQVEVQQPTRIIHVRMQITKTCCPICGDHYEVVAQFRERLQAAGGADI